MKIPFSWLKEFVEVKLSAEEVADKLTSIGIEVEGIDKVQTGFNGVIVAQITSVEKHPEADKLVIANVFTGSEELQIVCGAPNCRPGLKVALAKIGASLKSLDGKEFLIKKSKIRGVESFGMLCGAEELGLSSNGDGLIELPSSLALGQSMADLYAKTVLDISLTPNLSHCMSVMGVARELAALLNQPLKLPEISLQTEITKEPQLQIENKENGLCPRYSCRLIKNVKVAPSPDWLKQRLEESGIQPINNVVDVTNYVLLELGHPLHAFDYNKIESQKVLIRKAKEGEEIETLDGKKRVLSHHQLVIADSYQAIAIAGVMGGANSEVDATTDQVLLEAAYFDASNIRLTSRTLNLSTEASKRFERGVDPNQISNALNRATELIIKIAGGIAVNAPTDICASSFPPLVVQCRLEQVNRILGTTISKGEVENIFNQLQFPYSCDHQEIFSVQVPTYRKDIHLEIDLIEEVARFYGYHHILQKQTTYSSSNIPNDPLYLFEKKVGQLLVEQGLQECVTCDLIGPSLLEIVQDPSIAPQATIRVLNPTSIEQSLLRTSLLPGLLQVIKHNIDHQNSHFAGFEIGRLHFKEKEQYKEPTVVAIALCGKSSPHQWDRKGCFFDFYDLKGIIENLLQELGIKGALFKNTSLKTLHTGRQASIFVDAIEIGSFGEVHPAILRRLDVSQRILFAELHLKHLMTVSQEVKAIKPLVSFPGMERDWTITVSEALSYATIIEAIVSQASPILEEVFLKDVYCSEKLPSGFCNLTFRFKYRDSAKTLELETVESVHKRLTETVLKQFLQEIKTD